MNAALPINPNDQLNIQKAYQNLLPSTILDPLKNKDGEATQGGVDPSKLLPPGGLLPPRGFPNLANMPNLANLPPGMLPPGLLPPGVMPGLLPPGMLPPGGIPGMPGMLPPMGTLPPMPGADSKEDKDN